MKDVEIRTNGDENSKQAILSVTFFYGMLIMLVAVLTNGSVFGFWMACLGVLVLIEFLQKFTKKCPATFINFINYLSLFIIEMGTMILCVALGLKVVELIGVDYNFFNDSKSILLIIGFGVIFLLYELVIGIRYLLSEKLNLQKENSDFKRELEKKYNLVNLLTFFATILTFMILARGLEKSSSDIAIEFFLSCSIIYVLLMHYSLKYRLNEKKEDKK